MTCMSAAGGRRHDDRVDGVFIPGLELAGEFYAEVVHPLLGQEFPGLRYAAALLGPGSEVLCFDTERSTDHDWGPRLQVFLGADDAERHAGPVTDEPPLPAVQQVARQRLLPGPRQHRTRR
jgi:hypothetical protein